MSLQHNVPFALTFIIIFATSYGLVSLISLLLRRLIQMKFLPLLAVHEAGHAVVAWSMNFNVEKIFIDKRRWAGKICFKSDIGRATNDYLWCGVATSVAGAMAEKAVSGRPCWIECSSDLLKALETSKKIVDSGYLTPPWSWDHLETSDLLNGLPIIATDEQRVIMEKAAAQAMVIICENRRLLDSLTDELLANQEISKERFVEMTTYLTDSLP